MVPDGYGDVSENATWRDTLSPGPTLDLLTTNFLRYLEDDFANIERSIRIAPNQEETG